MLLKLSKFFLYASLLAVVVVLSSTFFPFIGGKYYFFRVCIEASLALLILSWAFRNEPHDLHERIRRAFKNPIVIAVTVFAAAFLAATLFAYDARSAFWSNYERGEGGFQMLHYYAFFMLLVLLLQEARDYRRAFQVSLVAAALMILYGVFAAGLVQGFLGPYFDSGGAPVKPTLVGRIWSPDIRFQGSLGNPAYVAPYLFFSLFYAIWLWMHGTKNVLRNVAYGGLITFFFLFFYLSQTRGAFLGLIAAVIVFFLYIAVTSPRVRRYAVMSLAALFLIGGALFSFGDTPFVKNLPGGRLFSINLREDTAQTRFWTWGSAWEGFKERPLFGWGPENFSAVFDKHFDTRHYVPGKNTETWFDRAHSVVFDYLSEIGIVGFLAYSAIFVAFYYFLFSHVRRWLHERKASEPRARGERPNEPSLTASPALQGLLVAVPIGYLVQGLVLFDVLPIYINLFLFMAFAVAMLPHAQGERSHDN